MGRCGICVVENEGIPGLKGHVWTPVGVRVQGAHTIHRNHGRTKTALVELILSNHDTDCLTCIKNNSCELQQLAATLGINALEYPKLEKKLPN